MLHHLQWSFSRFALIIILYTPLSWAVSVHTVTDVRVIATDSVSTFYEGGAGKFRYGGEDDHGQTLLRASQASLLFSHAITQQWSFKAQLNADLEPHKTDLQQDIDVIHAFFQYNIQSDIVDWHMKGGFFFPPVSLEHGLHPWNTEWTITPSAMNSWISEEVRSLGFESVWKWHLKTWVFESGMGLFGYNDPAGSLLAYRGWSFNDRQTGLGEGIPLPVTDALSRGGVIPMQAHWVKPFIEVDDRPGYYGMLGFRNDQNHLLRYLYYDNAAKESEFNGSQYAWDTSFHVVSARLFVGTHLEILAQFMAGRTKMGIQANGQPVVDNRFSTAYIMPSLVWNDHRMSIRLESFSVEDDDAYLMENPNEEEGHALTLSYVYDVTKTMQVRFEHIRVSSEREDRHEFGLADRTKEYLSSLSAFIRF